VVAVGVTVYDVMAAPPGQKRQVAVEEGGSLAGALIMGAQFAAIGTAIGGPVGMVVGGIVGGVIGSGVGSELANLGQSLFQPPPTLGSSQGPIHRVDGSASHLL
jgi:phage tail tape-measure protein